MNKHTNGAHIPVLQTGLRLSKAIIVTKSWFYPSKLSNRMFQLVQKTLMYDTAWKFCLLKSGVLLKYLFTGLEAGS